MSIAFALYDLLLLLLPAADGGFQDRVNDCVCVSIGVVIDRTSRLGREQEVAARMAVDEINNAASAPEFCPHGYEFELHLVDSKGSAARAASSAIKLADGAKVDLLVGAISHPQAVLMNEINENTQKIPYLLLNPTATVSPVAQLQSQNVIQIGHDISKHTQCIASVIGYFGWKKVTAIYQQEKAFPLSTGVVTLLSDSLKPVDATVEHHMAFQQLPTSPGSHDSTVNIEKGLYELKSRTNRIFVVLQFSTELAIHLFSRAKHMGMMDKGYVWIVSDEIASLIDSLDSSVIESMQGVIGCKTHFVTERTSVRAFRRKFQQIYLASYPTVNEENSSPSIFSLRAYDTIGAISKALHSQIEGKVSKDQLLPNLLATNFDGLSGEFSFQNGALSEEPVFDIINIVGRSYNHLTFWSASTELSNKPLSRKNLTTTENGVNTAPVEFGPVLWPGRYQGIPPGWGSGADKEVLRIGVPATGAFRDFVNVSYNQNLNRTEVAGFAIQVFKASLNYLPYHFAHELIPVDGSYDEMLKKILLKELDGAVGDTNILAERYPWAEFTQPYVKSGLALVVTVKPDTAKQTWMFMEAFEPKMWIIIPSASLFIGFVIWLIEHKDNPDFSSGQIHQQVGTIVWFSVEVLFFAQREHIKHTMSKIVLTPWFMLVMILTSSFTASLTSKLTVSQLLPSVRDIETLRRHNAVIGCNAGSFICRYLVNIFNIKPENIREISSIDDYAEAFERGDIKAAVFVTQHATVFLAKYCKGYTLAGPIFTSGGLGFAFPKGSPLALDFSEAIIKAVEKGIVHNMAKDMLSRYNCTSEDITTSGLEFRPFSALFYISGSTAVVALLLTIIPQAKEIFSFITDSRLGKLIREWSLYIFSSLQKPMSKWMGLNLFYHPL